MLRHVTCSCGNSSELGRGGMVAAGAVCSWWLGVMGCIERLKEKQKDTA
jgi:hypothetical protein